MLKPSILIYKLNKYDLIILGVVLFLGTVNIPMAFTGDQALFTVGAKQIYNGDIYYLDFWDLKQPGIYLFYLIAGSVFGFNEIGIHIFELIYFFIFSVILILSLKGFYSQNKILVSFLPLFTTGIYYLISQNWHLTQIEIIVAFPIFLSLIFSAKEDIKYKKLFILFSGFFAALVFLLKSVYILIPLSFIIARLVKDFRSGSGIKVLFLDIALPYFFGVLIPIISICVYFYLNDALTIFYQTSITLPPQVALYSAGKNIFKALLWEGVKWFIKFGIITPVIFFASFQIFRKEKELIFWDFALWLYVGFFCILLQKHGWWQYYYYLLIFPIGLLFSYGLDRILIYYKEKQKFFIKNRYIFYFLVAIPFLIIFSIKVIKLYKAEFKPDYKEIIEYSNFLSDEDAMKGDIFVFGSPLYYYVNNRKQAVPINGWSPEYLIPVQWDTLSNQIINAKPVYILAGVMDNKLNIKAKKLINFLRENYIVFKTSKGYWLKLKNNKEVVHKKIKYYKIF